MKKALRKANLPRNEAGVARNCHRKKGPEKIAQQAKESLVIGNEDHIGKNKNAQTKERNRKDELFGDPKPEIIGREVKDNAKEKQDIVSQHGEEDVKDDVQRGQNIVVDEMTKNKRASRKTHQFTNKDKCIARNSRRAKELDKTAQNASKSLLIVENQDNTDINKKTETEEQNTVPPRNNLALRLPASGPHLASTLPASGPQSARVRPASCPRLRPSHPRASASCVRQVRRSFRSILG